MEEYRKKLLGACVGCIKCMIVCGMVIVLLGSYEKKDIVGDGSLEETVEFIFYNQEDYEGLSDEEKIDVFIAEVITEVLSIEEIEELARVLYWDDTYEYKLLYVMGVNWVYGEERAIELIDEIYLDPGERFNMKVAMYRYNEGE